ncbi:MAG: DoxX family protein [Sphingomonas bacterium]|uniref:DoxX family protein n=1 Tax=Sphingomonas bacterium TaxID=1895847 RepID=UPI0026254E17|nr:DoxX family protein [Sphingomonas bacterium]MDB5709147.1 DoxX family protein [Sphingomonas bacterium]
MTFLDRWAPQLHAALRIVAALLFMEHGLMKLFHFPAAQPGAPTPLPMMLVVAAVIEVGGGALIALGLFTRLAAFICAGEMAVAYFMAHAPRGFWPALNMGEGAVLFTFIFLFLAAAGPGAWSLDGTMGKRR